MSPRGIQSATPSSFSHFEIVSKLGQGGMGEVWRAEDTRLGRAVAVKFLPSSFADDRERHDRFEREAKLLASLNHPNIATLYGLEHLDGQHVLVMELVEGEGLDERIARGPVPADETIRIAVQIAEALEAAHARGIVHRDLKPANIRIRPDGTVKVLDFGLAKAWIEADDGVAGVSMSPTLTRRETAAGVLLGTAAYMSPEQARGKPVDGRADIWALGVVLWEMLTGKRLFAGETVSDVLAAVLRAEPDLEALPPTVPPAVRRVVRRCLARDPQSRLQCAGDARLELESGGEEAPLEQIAAPVRTSRLGLLVGLLGAAVAAAALAWPLLAPRAAVERPVLRVNLSEAGFKPFSNSAISPDDGWVAYQLQDQGSDLQLRRLDSFDVRSVSGTSTVENPFFSPDGRWLAYFDATYDGLGKVALASGVPQQIPGVTVSSSFNTGCWHPDGFLIITSAVIDGHSWNGLARVPDAGGEATVLTTPEPNEIMHLEPVVVPGTEWVLFTNQAADEDAVWAVSLDSGERKRVVGPATSPVVLASGHLLVYRSTQQNVALYRFDMDRAQVTGDPMVVVQGVGEHARYGGRYAVSAAGTLIYSPSDGSSALQGGSAVVWVNREGAVEQVFDKRSSWRQPRLSPDGKRVLIRQVLTPECDLWAFDLARGTLTRVTFEHDTHDPLWHPSGDRVIYSGGFDPNRVLYTVPADGTGKPELLAEIEASMRAASWSADGRLLALAVDSPTVSGDVWVLDLEAGGDPRPFLDSRFAERYPSFSPDGRWLAYASDESGRFEVYARPYPGPGGRVQLSTDGGIEPRWSGNGREVFYRRDEDMMAVDVRAGTSLEAGRQKKLFSGSFQRPSRVSQDVHSYDVSADGSRFLMVQGDATSGTNPDLRMVFGWTDTLGLE